MTSVLPRCSIDKQTDAPVLAQLVMASSELSMEAGEVVGSDATSNGSLAWIKLQVRGFANDGDSTISSERSVATSKLAITLFASI